MGMGDCRWGGGGGQLELRGAEGRGHLPKQIHNLEVGRYVLAGLRHGGRVTGVAACVRVRVRKCVCVCVFHAWT